MGHAPTASAPGSSCRAEGEHSVTGSGSSPTLTAKATPSRDTPVSHANPNRAAHTAVTVPRIESEYMTIDMSLIDSESQAPPDITEPIDATAQLPNSVKRRGKWSEPVDAGRYLQVEGFKRTLSIPIAGQLVHLGRGLSADIRIDDRSVSRRHAVLVLHKTGQRILDDRSYNGTFVNGLRVARAEVHDGDVIALGRFLLRFRDVPEWARSVHGADRRCAIHRSWVRPLLRRY